MGFIIADICMGNCIWAIGFTIFMAGIGLLGIEGWGTPMGVIDRLSADEVEAASGGIEFCALCGGWEAKVY